MATNRELEQKLKQLEALLASRGLSVEEPITSDPRDRPDFIDWTTPEHAGLIGLVVLTESESPPTGQQHILPGKIEGNMYCLEDELGSMRYHPGLALGEVAPVLLRQAIGEYESGAPKVPDNAPPMWTPTPAAEFAV